MELFKEKLHFASDYMEGAHPKVLEALVRTNALSTPGYGDDEFCRAAERLILAECACPDGEVRFLTGGTQTNAVVIDALLRSYQGVVAAESGHVAVHEAGAIEFGGHKVLPVPQKAGKLSADGVRQAVSAYREDANRDHMVMPGMVYLSQPTEYGTLYSRAELKEISGVCRENGLWLYVDGARLAYALAAPENDVTLRDLAALTDVFYIGGTKCGALFGEAVVIPKRDLIPHFFSIIKQHGALLAKGRLLGVQFGALFEDGLYGRVGLPAIRSARSIREQLVRMGYELPFPSPTNQIFVVLDDGALERLGKNVEYGFMEKTDGTRTMIRLAAAWSTTEDQTRALLTVLEE